MNQNIGRFSGVVVVSILVALLMLATGNTAWAQGGGTVPPPPPPVTGPVGTGGGTTTLGDATVTVPAGAVPNGSTISVGKPNPNSLPDKGGFRIPGGNLLAISVIGPDGKPITSGFNPKIKICFTLPAAVVQQVGGAGMVTIDWFNSQTGKFEPQPTTQTPGTNQFCTEVDHLSIYGLFFYPDASEALANTESADLSFLLPLGAGLLGLIGVGAVLKRRK
ncbi:MAG: hypothetical protein HY327_11535 [Chloroflexi bacterium]|nr:hypothetical protein [Chloroflexota bacterium]